jgi:hypothetical protein
MPWGSRPSIAAVTRIGATNASEIRQRLSSNVKLFRRQATHLVLAGPFNRHVTKARYAHSVREPAINGRFDKVGRKEGKRDRHVDLASAAALGKRADVCPGAHSYNDTLWNRQDR